MSVIGIDFGTSFCTASWVNPKTNAPEAIMFPNAVNVYKIPSVVMFPESGNPIVGTPAYLQIENAASSTSMDAIQSRTITSIKRKMSRSGSFRGYSHKEIISMIIRYVVEQAKTACVFPESPDRLVLTHPVKFEEWKKDMLKQAAVQAGFQANNISLIEEPVAAALEHVKSNPQANAQGILVYDFGGGTFDVAYIQIDHNGKPHIPIDPEGDPQCGGDDIDLLIYDKWETIAKQKLNRLLSSNIQEADLAFLLQCRKHKELLSSTPNNRFTVLLPPLPGRGLDRCEWKTTEMEYNTVISPIIDKTISQTQTVLNEIERQKLPLDVVLLIGGSSRIPQVEQRLTNLLRGKAIIRTTGKVDTAVSVGAVYYATEGFTAKKNASKSCFCIHCGNKIASNDRFCMFCGRENYLFQ